MSNSQFNAEMNRFLDASTCQSGRGLAYQQFEDKFPSTSQATLGGNPTTPGSQYLGPAGPLTLPPFYTTGAILTTYGALEVCGILLDSGASSNFISAEAANEAGLVLQLCAPTGFTLADGTQSFHNICTTATLYLTGVSCELSFFVLNPNTPGSSGHIILGMPGWRAFRIKTNFEPLSQELRVTVAKDETHARRFNILLPRDPPIYLPLCIMWFRDLGLPACMRQGETVTERKARATLEKARATLEKAQARERSGVTATTFGLDGVGVAEGQMDLGDLLMGFPEFNESVNAGEAYDGGSGAAFDRGDYTY